MIGTDFYINENVQKYGMVGDDLIFEKTKQKHNTISVGHDYVQTNTNNVNKT
jgi:hypothetical protein